MLNSGNWHKSTFSFPDGNCVEARWKKSTVSNPSGNCVEVRSDGDLIQIRDTKDNGTGPTLSFTFPEWEAFVAGARAGEFDVPA